jgi:hypothetical protein
MYLIENGKINIDIEIEFIILPKNYESEVIQFPLLTKYKDFCQLKLKFLPDTSVTLILSLIAHLETILHDAGHALNNNCYEFRFNVLFENITDDVKSKLSNINYQILQLFFGITNDELTNNGDTVKNLIAELLKCF